MLSAFRPRICHLAEDLGSGWKGRSDAKPRTSPNQPKLILSEFSRHIMSSICAQRGVGWMQDTRCPPMVPRASGNLDPAIEIHYRGLNNTPLHTQHRHTYHTLSLSLSCMAQAGSRSEASTRELRRHPVSCGRLHLHIVGAEALARFEGACR